jgi:RNA polymerase sigma-70 factor (ECF subfamily)
MDHDRQRDGAAFESSIDLILRAREGDRKALDTLFERYVPPLRRWASGRLPRWVRDMVDTDDLVQETLIKTMRQIDHFEVRRDGALHAYMRQALRHRIVDEVRRAGRRPPQDALPEAEQHRGPSPLEETIGREAVERYERALADLDESDRHAIVGRIEMGLGYDELALTLGKPSRDAARMAVSRALVRLAQGMDRE